MNFKDHSTLIGKHAFLSASQYAWTNYDEEKLDARYISFRAAARGTQLHDLAHKAIQLGIKLSKAEPTLSMYVNDAIGYKMAVEQPLYYSDNCFGTADTISFRRNTLRCHDLKTGLVKASFRQLEVYDALFCLEYSVDPYDITIENRIYQNKEVHVQEPEPEHVSDIMEKIIAFDARIEALKEEL